MASYSVDCIYSLQHIRNLRSIGEHGILSRNRVQRLGLTGVDLSDESVQSGRRTLELNDRPLHDYVPLFFRPLTPMEYVICVRQGKRNEVAMIEIATDVFALPGVVFCDGNARAGETIFYDELEDLANLDWDILDTPDAYTREYKRKKSAEVLVPDVVPSAYVVRVCVTGACVIPRGLGLTCVRDESVFP